LITAFSLYLILISSGVLFTLIALYLYYKKSQVVLFYSFYQLCLLGATLPLILNSTTFNSGFALVLTNFMSLLFYFFILTIPPTFYNFVGFSLNKEFVIHSKIYRLSFGVLGVNTISFFYLTFGDASDLFLNKVVENVMNYTNFISYLFVFPIIVLYYIYNVFRLMMIKEETKNKLFSIQKESFPVFMLAINLVLFLALFFLYQLLNDVTFVSYLFIFVTITLFLGNLIYFFKLLGTDKKVINKEDFSEDFSYFTVIEESLEKYIINKRNFTNPKITLKECAKGISSNEKYLSNYLNKVMNMNFNTYINNLRIDEAKSLLISSDSDLYTIEAIAKMAGFNSKSSFNAVFKKHVGMTPSEFKNKNR